MGPRGLLVALLLVAALVFAPTALAAGDPVARGSFHLKLLRSFHNQLRRNGVAMKPKAFSVKQGSIDPITGTGKLTLKGKLRFKHDHKKVVYTKLTATLGSNGVLKSGGVKLFKLRGGAVARNGFGADISGVKAGFLKGAAKKINKKLGLHSLHRASAGSLSVSEQPQTVEVTGGTVHVVPDPTLTAGSGTLTSKLFAHCIVGLTDITAIGPGIKNPPLSTPTFDFPVTGGTISPQGTDGVVNSAGGIELSNTNGNVGDCDTAPPPLAKLQQTDSSYNLLNNYISSHVVIEGSVPMVGDQGVGIGSNLDTANATVSASPVDHSVTVNGTVIRINKGSALFLNQAFPQPTSSYDASMEFASGDLYGTVNLTVTTR